MIRNMLLYAKKKARFYDWEHVLKCPLCEGRDFAPYRKVRSGFLSIHLTLCNICGLVLQSPRLSERSLKDFYSNEYRFNLKKNLNKKNMDKLFSRGIRRGAYICEFFDKSKIDYKDSTVFELGCAYGGILEQFRKRGCQVKGCDLDKDVVKYGMLKGLDLICGSVDMLLKDEGKADIVILSHVLEHIIEPYSFLNKVHQLLKENGVLYIEVPGINSKKNEQKRYAQLGHIAYFNLDTTKKMAQKTNFEFIAGNEIVQSVFRKTNSHCHSGPR